MQMKANKWLDQWGQVKDTKLFKSYLAIKSGRKRIFLPLIRTPTIIDSEQGQEDLGMSNSNISNNLKKEYFFRRVVEISPDEDKTPTGRRTQLVHSSINIVRIF
jgi:hypothetical protein